jgi:hypothetical protein
MLKPSHRAACTCSLMSAFQHPHGISFSVDLLQGTKEKKEKTETYPPSSAMPSPTKFSALYCSTLSSFLSCIIVCCICPKKSL